MIPSADGNNANFDETGYYVGFFEFIHWLVKSKLFGENSSEYLLFDRKGAFRGNTGLL